MPVTIVNKLPDAVERERINQEVESLLDGTPDIWHVRILPAQENDDVEVRANCHRREFSKTFSGQDGQLSGAIRQFIEASLAAVEHTEQSGQSSSPKQSILNEFRLLSGKSEGIESWITDTTDEQVFPRLSRIDSDPLSMVQLNQLLLLGREAGVSDGFFHYYWLSRPDTHPYDVATITGYDPKLLGGETIQSLKHLFWGLYRLYVDALLFFGNVRSGYRYLRPRSELELKKFFASKRFDTDAVRKRGPALPLVQIPKDNRYLISEMACKSYGSPEEGAELKRALLSALENHLSGVGGKISIRSLLDGSYVKQKYAETQQQFIFSADDILAEEVSTPEELEQKFAPVLKKFLAAREAALQNTRFYLSMVNDLDVYVATSMRNRQDFRGMADACESIFSDRRLKALELRYFDPTLSAAAGHEDKGLIECLMVKCAKVLVYCAGEKESYGKDAEAAMALSLGKPVIFFCDAKAKGKFYRDVHPLSRLIDFSSGVAVGAIVASSLADVSELLFRSFENKMEYELEQPRPGYFGLKEKLTGSVVRVQTNDDLLRETFWNYYHNRPVDDA
jgi:hypothetical protein